MSAVPGSHLCCFSSLPCSPRFSNWWRHISWLNVQSKYNAFPFCLGDVSDGSVQIHKLNLLCQWPTSGHAVSWVCPFKPCPCLSFVYLVRWPVLICVPGSLIPFHVHLCCSTNSYKEHTLRCKSILSTFRLHWNIRFLLSGLLLISKELWVFCFVLFSGH